MAIVRCNNTIHNTCTCTWVYVHVLVLHIAGYDPRLIELGSWKDIVFYFCCSTIRKTRYTSSTYIRKLHYKCIIQKRINNWIKLILDYFNDWYFKIILFRLYLFALHNLLRILFWKIYLKWMLFACYTHSDDSLIFKNLPSLHFSHF